MPPGFPLKTKGPLMLMIRELVRGGFRVVVERATEDSVVLDVASVALPGRRVVATKMGSCLAKLSAELSLCGVRCTETKAVEGNLI